MQFLGQIGGGRLLEGIAANLNSRHRRRRNDFQRTNLSTRISANATRRLGRISVAP
jgi:hypothetical protein